MKKIKSRNFKHSPIALAVALTLTVPMSINQVQAGAGWGDNANMVTKVPTYYANSPSGLRSTTSCFTAAGAPALPALGGACDSGTALRKFVNNLPLPELSGTANTHVPLAGDIGAGYIPIANPEKWINAQGLKTNDDYYEIAAIEYSEKKHSDLPATGTRLRLYVQLETVASSQSAGNSGTSRHIALKYPDGVTPITDPLRVTAANPTGQVYAYDTPHSMGPIINATKGVATRIKFTNYLPFGTMKGAQHFLPVDKTMQSAGVGPDGMTTYTENRIAVHLHGGDGPWVSAGSAHQWFVPAGETAAYAAGMGKGQSAKNVPDMPDPGNGSYTLYYPNNQNGRFMWYHDQASGIIRLNVYAGMAAGYTLKDPTEVALVASGVLPGTKATATAAPVADEIPLMIQDVSFVPKDVAVQDANWNFDGITAPSAASPWGQYGDLWFPHVYEINQDPNSPTGWTPVGRWDWGPWFWPVFPAQFSIPSGLLNDVTWVPNAYMDTMMVNGTVYPTLTVEPKPYRMRFMNNSNDRFINLGFYLADTTSATAVSAAAATGVLGTEVSMVPFTTGYKRADGTTVAFPAYWGQVTSMMSHPAGVPDPQFTGPDIIQIGNEGGFLPQAVVTPSTITNFEWNRRSVTVSNILEHGVLLGGGEVADTVVDFTGFAGKTLILYNDAPNMVPAGEPRVDYYTGDPDQTGQGGAEPTKPGFGPNTRTVMRVVVSAAMKAGTTSSWPAGGTGATQLVNQLPAAYAASGQQPPVVTSIAYNQAFGTTNIDNFLKISSGSSKQPDLILAPPGPVTITSVSLADSGGFYTSMPQVVFTPPGGAVGSGAAAVVGGELGGITVVDTKLGGINPSAGAFPGAGYTSAPTVVFSGGTYPGGGAITWPQPAADLAKYGPLPTATAVVAPVLNAAPSLSNISTAAIAVTASTYNATPTVPVTISFPSAGMFTYSYTIAGVTTVSAPAAYTSPQAIVISQAGRSPFTVTITNGAAGTVAPQIGDKFTVTANPNAGTISDIVLATLTSATVAAYVPGTFATVPTVTLVGGGAGPTFKPAIAKALSSGRLNWIGMVPPPAGTPIIPYSAIPLVDFVGGNGIGATAQVHVANPIVYPIRNKGIQELYEFTYGRLNGGMSVELPFTTVAIQTTVPVAYIDPVSETLADGETQIWKITHNGLFTHPVYFNHLDVQLINRVGWDGTIKAPYPDELGWKDTVRCNQLEDVYIAVRPKQQPNAGFGVPESNRLWDPSQSAGGVGSGMGFTAANLAGSPVATDPTFNANFGVAGGAPINQTAACDPVYVAPAVAPLPSAQYFCLDNEFTWTNGMLGWAELDFMRPIAFHPFVKKVITPAVPASAPGVVPVVAAVPAVYGNWITSPWSATPGVQAAPLPPTLLSVTSGATGNTLTWADNSTTEYQFTILRGTAALGPFTPLVVPALANATSYVDTTAVAGTAYWYQVQAVGAKMDVPSTSNTVSVTAPAAAPAAPGAMTVTNITRTSLQLNWTAPAAGTVTGYNVYQNGVAVPAANLVFGAALNNVVVSGLAAGVTYQFTLQAKNGTSTSAFSVTVPGTTTAPMGAPAAPTATLVTPTGFTLNWVDVTGAVSYDIYQNGVFLINVLGAGIAGTAQSTPITGLLTGASYNYTVVAVASAAGAATKVSSAKSAMLNLMLSPGVTVTPGLTTDTSVTVTWSTIPGATDYWVYVNGQPWNYVGPGFTAGSGNLVAAGATQTTQLNTLLPSTTYALTLMWGTAAGNSSQSVATSVTTLPAAAGAPAVSATSSAVTLSWAAVAGATAYIVQDNGVTVYTGPLLTATLPTLPGSLHSYTVASTVGTLTSGASAALPVLTPSAAPTIVGGSAAVTASGLTLSWAPVAGATSYTIYQNGTPLAPITGTPLAPTPATTLPLTNLMAGSSYSFTVVASTGTVVSAKSAVLPVLTPMAAPSIASSTPTSLVLNWLPAAGATGYTVYQNGVALPAVVGTATTRNITGLTAGGAYSFTVAYSSAAVPLSQQSAPYVSGALPSAPLAAPTAFAVSNSSLTLNWVAPAAAVNYYVVYNNGVEIARPAAGVTTYAVTGLAASTNYNFSVAYDSGTPAAALPRAAASPVLTVSTTAAPVAAPVAPAVPAQPVASLITATGFTLNWAAVSGATDYTVYQNGVALPTVTGTSVTRAITGLTAGTAYSYTVVATNAGGASAQSLALSVSTTVTQLTQSGAAAPVPTAVPGAAGSGSVTLNWLAPTVNGIVVATSYVVYQNGVMLPLVAGAGTSRAVAGLTPGTSYNFRVAYRNAVNVLSAPSGVLTVVAP